MGAWPYGARECAMTLYDIAEQHSLEALSRFECAFWF
jgi:hypothetical protein